MNYSFIMKVLLFLRSSSSFGYDDLSSGKAAYQSTTSKCTMRNCSANVAVDRNIITCIRTEPIGYDSYMNSVWWYVDLGDIYSVHSISVLFKTYEGKYDLRQRGRFAGFSLFLSNTTNKEDGYRCYKDGPELPPLNFSTACIGHSRYVIYYNERKQNVKYPPGYEIISYTELCEVIVKGCSEGLYGVKCDVVCPSNCKENRCDTMQGICLRCKPGWIGMHCQTPCESGLYGPECRFQCGLCGNGVTCNHISGTCNNGCASGWMGTICNTPCGNGTFGQNCVFNCSGHCLNRNTCNRETGHCDSGCTPGYIGDFCNKVCTPGWFGSECKQRCSGYFATADYCNHVEGVWCNGCKNGYIGQFCDKSCERGYFGKNCSNICSQNCNEICRHTDGHCLCKTGWMGSPMCSTGCPLRRYGENCIHSCSPNCINDTCNRFNGSCTERCKDPYIGLICDQREDISRPQYASHSAKPLIIGAVFGACAFVATLIVVAVFLIRKGILPNFAMWKRHSQRCVTGQKAFTSPKDDPHAYQVLNISKDTGNYVNTESMKNDSNYQELCVSKNEENYINIELGAI